MRSIFLAKPDPLELRRKMASAWGKLWIWFPALVSVMVIVVESTDTFSASHTSGWLRPVVERITGPIRDATWEEVHHYFRKTGHFCGYGTVCLTFLRAWLLSFGRLADLEADAWRWRSVFAAIGSTAFVASMDELHQSFIPSRTGTVHDVLLDSLGGTVSCGLVWLFFWRRRQRALMVP